MALSSANASAPLDIPFSVGKVRVQKKTFSVANLDTSGTVTFDGLHSISHVEVEGVLLTAAVTMSGNVATLAFVDPAATHYGTITAYGA
jgi:hypothetical protein